MPDQTHGDLIRLDPAGQSQEEVLRRIPLGTPASAGGIDESSLQDLLFRHPRSLPIPAIDAAYSDPVPVCRELYTAAGYVDALYINPLGRLILAEFKLWRNPQARREVIGQILDYTKELASWTYEDLQREVSRARKMKGNVPFELVREQAPGVDEAEFVDNVARHLRRGEFLLLIIGDAAVCGVAVFQGSMALPESRHVFSPAFRLPGQPTSMQVVSVIAQKGGAGKTTLSLAIACAAAAEGLSAVVVDLDP